MMRVFPSSDLPEEDSSLNASSAVSFCFLPIHPESGIDSRARADYI